MGVAPPNKSLKLTAARASGSGTEDFLGGGSLAPSFTESEKKSVWRVAMENHLFKKPHVRSDFQRLLAQRRGRNNQATEAPSDSRPL